MFVSAGETTEIGAFAWPVASHEETHIGLLRRNRSRAERRQTRRQRHAQSK
jgi:hypothetical protein